MKNFVVKSRTKSMLRHTIHAEMEQFHMTVYLDTKTKCPLYPLFIDSSLPGVEIGMDSDMEYVTVPPSIPTLMINQIIDILNEVPDVIIAAKDLIDKEQHHLKAED